VIATQFTQSNRLDVLFIPIAILTGLIVATQPTWVAMIVFFTLTCGLLFAISPLSAFVVMLVIAPMRSLIAAEANISLPLDVGQISLAIVIFIWVIHKILQKRGQIQLYWSSAYIPVSIFLIATGISVLGAFSINAWLTEWLKWLTILALMIVIVSTFRQREWQWLVFGLVAAGSANALVGIYIFLGGSGADHLRISTRFIRAFGTFGQPNPFGGFMGLLAPLALMMAYTYLIITWHNFQTQRAISTKNSIWLGFYSAAALLLSIGVIISWSRGAWLSYGVSILIVAFALPRYMWQRIALMTIIGVIAAGLFVTDSIPSAIQDRVLSATTDIFNVTDVRAVDITTENYAVVERLAHWQAATNMIQHHPLTGVGFGNYEVAYDTYRLLNWLEPLGHAHNYYLNVFAETGMIGLLGYAMLWLWILNITWQNRSHPDLMSRSISVGLMGSWTYLLTHSLTDNLYVNNMFLHLGVMLGIVAVLHCQNSSAYQVKES